MAGSHWHCEACSQLMVSYRDSSKKLSLCSKTKDPTKWLLYAYNLGFGTLTMHTKTSKSHPFNIFPFGVLEPVQMSACINKATLLFREIRQHELKETSYVNISAAVWGENLNPPNSVSSLQQWSGLTAEGNNSSFGDTKHILMDSIILCEKTQCASFKSISGSRCWS